MKKNEKLNHEERTGNLNPSELILKDIQSKLPEDLEIKLRVMDKFGGKIIDSQSLTVGELDKKADYVREMGEKGYTAVVSYPERPGRTKAVIIRPPEGREIENQEKEKVEEKNKSPEKTPEKKWVTSWDYIKENWDKNDRLAVVMVNKEKNDVVQKFAKAENIASQKYQKYLRYMNANGYNIYVSMNAIKEGENARTKDAIKNVSHVYLDIDENGKKVLDNIKRDVQEGKLPQPNYIMETSPGKYQVIWKTQGFDKQEAEKLMRAMASKYGTDRAATDVSRVLRIPGFQNKKYPEHFRVKAEKFTDEVYSPERFKIERPKTIERQEEKSLKQNLKEGKENKDKNKIEIKPEGDKKERPEQNRKPLTQSEVDWHRAVQRVLHRDLLHNIAKDLSKERQDKPNPEYYATITTAKAYAKVSASRGTDPEKVKAVIQKEFKNFPNIEQISENAVKEYYQMGKER